MTVTVSFMQGLNLFCLDESPNSVSPFLPHPPSITIVTHTIMIPIIYSKSSVPFMSMSRPSLYLMHMMAFSSPPLLPSRLLFSFLHHIFSPLFLFLYHHRSACILLFSILLVSLSPSSVFLSFS